MSSKTLMLSRAIFEQQEKGRKAVERRTKKRQKTSPAGWLCREWKTAFAKSFPGVVVEWTGAEASLAKKLIDEGDFNQALNLITHFLETWDRRKQSRKGPPSFRFMWAMRGTLLAEMKGLAKVPELREHKIASGEFSEASEQASPIHGWGEVDNNEDFYDKCEDGW